MPILDNIPQTTDSNIVFAGGSVINTSGTLSAARGHGITSITDTSAGVVTVVFTEKYPYMVSCVASLSTPAGGATLVLPITSAYTAATGTLVLTLLTTSTGAAGDPAVGATRLDFICLFARANSLGAGAPTLA